MTDDKETRNIPTNEIRIMLKDDPLKTVATLHATNDLHPEEVLWALVVCIGMILQAFREQMWRERFNNLIVSIIKDITDLSITPKNEGNMK